MEKKMKIAVLRHIRTIEGFLPSFLATTGKTMPCGWHSPWQVVGFRV